MATIFYSWQSDAPNNTNRSFIEQALKLAVGDLNTDVVEAERDEAERDKVELTQDTQGVPGTPDIAATILAKIESSQVFVCDVSLVLTGKKAKGGTRLCPNPNVMLELGYAMKALGQDRILMVCNTAFGRIEDLPFDLRGKRPVPYTADLASDLPAARKAFAKELTKRIQEILSIEQPPAHVPDPRDVALDAIADQAPNRKALVRVAIKSLLGELDSLNLAPDTSRAADDELFRVLESSKTVHWRFFARRRSGARRLGVGTAGARSAVLRALRPQRCDPTGPVRAVLRDRTDLAALGGCRLPPAPVLGPTAQAPRRHDPGGQPASASSARAALTRVPERAHRVPRSAGTSARRSDFASSRPLEGLGRGSWIAATLNRRVDRLRPGPCPLARGGGGPLVAGDHRLRDPPPDAADP